MLRTDDHRDAEPRPSALIPVPNFGAGSMTPEGSLHTFIDQKVLPGRFPAAFYGPGDSLGVLSTLTAACSVLLGVFAALFLSGVMARAEAVRAVIIPLGALSIKWLGLLFLHRHRLFFSV